MTLADLKQPRFRPFVRFACVAAVAGGIVFTLPAVRGQSQPPKKQNRGYITLSPDEQEATSRTSDESDVSAFSPGIVREVLVKKGDVVKKGQPLIQQDDRIERAQLDTLQNEATSTVRVDAYKADKGVKEAQLKRIKDAPDGVYGATEVEEKTSAVTYAEAQIGVGGLDHAKSENEAKAQQIKVDEMLIKAPFDGVVEKIPASVGEMISPERPAIRIVKNDPIEVEWNPQTDQAARVKLGDKFQVRYANEQEWQTATVTYLAPVAQVTRRTVIMQLPNPSNRETGVQMVVKVPQKVLLGEETASAQQ